MHVVEDLDGTNVARALVQPTGVSLTLICPVYSIGNVSYRAESFSLGSWEGVEALHDLTGRMLSARQEAVL